MTPSVVPRSRRRHWFYFWQCPGFWVFVVTILAYIDPKALTGDFAYDDAGSVKRNVVVNGQVNVWEVFERDYWGTPMSEVSSHKSFRPITTLSFKLNWILAGGDAENVDSTLGFHIVNVLLHGIVSWFVTKASSHLFFREENQLLVGLLFGLHPLHAEAVSNITSRGELWASLFLLLAFLSYTKYTTITTNDGSKRNINSSSTVSSFFGIYVIPWICMTLSTFSKEQGATTLITLVAFDFIMHQGCVRTYLQRLFQRDASAIHFTKRALILAIQTLIVCAWRYWLNGETSPDFIVDQNPAGFAKERFVRIFSVNWIYCLYVWDALFPKNLCCDWSGNSIELIENKNDVRIFGVMLLWVFVGWNIYLLIFGRTNKERSKEESNKQNNNTNTQIMLAAFFAFMFSPFLLSSNLLVVVGLMKADRVVYLPLLGFCMLEVLLFQMLFVKQQQPSETDKKAKTTATRTSDRQKGRYYWLGYTLIMIQLIFFSRKLHERNLAWSNNLNLWMSAYDVNPKSYHTMYNCGYELSLKGYYKQAEQVMRPIGSAHVNGPSNTFVYAMTLYNLNLKEKAREYVDEALEVIEQQRNDASRNPSARNRPELLARTESNLLVAKALTYKDLRETGQFMYKAVQADPRNQYAISQAQNVMEKLSQLNMI